MAVDRKKNSEERSLDKYLSGIYYDQKSGGGFSGFKKLIKEIQSRGDVPSGVTPAKVKKWLKKQDTWSVFKQRNVKFEREPIIASEMFQTFECDLADLSSIKKYNNGFCFILVVIDIFSKRAWLRPLKSKKGKEVTNAMADILKNLKRTPLRLRSDLGGEFINRSFKQLMQKYKIHHYFSFSEKHCVFAERLIKSIKKRLFSQFYHNQSYRYIDSLADIESGYNSSYHSKIKMAPDDVNENNQLAVYMKVYMPIINAMARKKPKFSFKIGSHVRISHMKDKFSRSYHETFTEEIFVVKSRIHSTPPRYELTDLLHKPVKGSFYENELVAVDYDPNKPFKIEKVIKHRKLKGRPRESLVQWYGYPSSHNTFIPSSHVKKYTSTKK